MSVGRMFCCFVCVCSVLIATLEKVAVRFTATPAPHGLSINDENPDFSHLPKKNGSSLLMTSSRKMLSRADTRLHMHVFMLMTQCQPCKTHLRRTLVRVPKSYPTIASC